MWRQNVAIPTTTVPLLNAQSNQIEPYHQISYINILYHFISYHTTTCSISYHNILQNTISYLPCIILYYTVSYHIIPYRSMTCHAKQNHTVSWQALESPTIMLNQITKYYQTEPSHHIPNIIKRHIISYHIISYRTISFNIVS